MVPIDTPQSMLLDPSKGSNVTMYLPRKDGSSITITRSSSSETRKQHLPEATSAFLKMSLASTSSFFTSSP
ncbi:hypothetical protein BC936DRAFT_138744 [Jimgerdemannia flammicorona]|uniref:Uncharacterized protein n=2 Tax=Jimgerdemannia flammicorona TaxID=994334 RepID=A0A433BLQ2_9FUNG|nr:hypothetical protein BC936DRAFT_138744 [Jimgerdemannia flammicorona]RUS34061.1 hypothetical protein BC938DRAFT_482637 [Jimgerdemannia flammicorona]